MNTTPTPDLGLDPRLMTLANVARAARAIRRCYRNWEDGNQPSPNMDDLMDAVEQAMWDSGTPIRFPFDAVALCRDDLWESGVEGASVPQLARIALTWANIA